MNVINRAALVGLVVLASGCTAPQTPPQTEIDEAKRAKVLKELPPPPKPPEVPAATAVPLDESLREAARQQILTSFRSNDIVTRCQAVESAQNGLGLQAAETVMSALSDSQPLVRFAGALAAGTLKLEPATSKLIALVDDPDPSVCVAVRYALHKLGDTSRSHDLESYAVSGNPIVRRNTVMVLGLLGEKSAVKILWAMQKDPDPTVRIGVAEALWRLGDDQGLKSCVAMCVSQFPDDQIIGVLALAAPRDLRVRPYLRGKLTTPYDEVNLAAARAMGMIGDDGGYGVALKGVKATDPRQRALAALAFGAIGRPDAQPMLAGLLKDQQESVRIAAAMAVLQLKGA